jgi:hypothetical protein
MIELSDMLRKTLPVGAAISFLLLACSGSSGGNGGGGAPADNCSNLAGAYSVTSEIVATDCPVGLHVITQPITWTFVQTAPSCSFTMTNSLYAGSQYSGYFTTQGTQATVTWTSVNPAPTSAGYALTYTSENLVIAAPGTLSGSFGWSSGYGCTGTTNICHGSVSSGCATPE